MMKAILFSTVLAVTISVGFFSPTPLDRLTMNLNIGDSPRGRKNDGRNGYNPPWDKQNDGKNGYNPPWRVEDDYEEVEVPVEIFNVLNEEIRGTLQFEDSDLCQDNKQKYGPLRAGSKNTVMISSYCHIVKITADPTRPHSQKCTAHITKPGLQEGHITISPNPKNPKDCRVHMDLDVQLPIEVVNVMNEEVSGRIKFQDTEVCDDNRQKYGPLGPGSENTVWISSFCHIIEITADPTRPHSQECTAFKSNSGIQDGRIEISPSTKNPNDCKVTKD